MSDSAQFLAGGSKPLRIVQITSGTGTFVPLVDTSRCFSRLTGSGSGGGNGSAGPAGGPYHAAGPGGSGGFGGSNGVEIEILHRVPIAGIPYVVGAPGAPNASGSYTRLAEFIAPGGVINTQFLLDAGRIGLASVKGGLGGVGGVSDPNYGVGLSGSPGKSPNPIGLTNSVIPDPTSPAFGTGGVITANEPGGGGGGGVGASSRSGPGGAGGNGGGMTQAGAPGTSASASNYGAGGGGGGGGCPGLGNYGAGYAGGPGGSGAGGCIEIWEYGA